jgi:hypothetical protein
VALAAAESLARAWFRPFSRFSVQSVHYPALILLKFIDTIEFRLSNPIERVDGGYHISLTCAEQTVAATPTKQ